MSRYVETPKNVEELVEEVRSEYFPNLEGCIIKILMDTKKRTSEGNITVASVKKANNIERFLTADEMANGGVDIIMIIDSNIFYNLDRDDQLRIVRHELRHIFYDNEAEQPYKIIGHDVNDFKIEIKLNQDDPDWDERVSAISQSVYAKD